jgi:hypothetical protein
MGFPRRFFGDASDRKSSLGKMTPHTSHIKLFVDLVVLSQKERNP